VVYRGDLGLVGDQPRDAHDVGVVAGVVAEGAAGEDYAGERRSLWVDERLVQKPPTTALSALDRRNWFLTPFTTDMLGLEAKSRSLTGRRGRSRGHILESRREVP
jgi:hypothetical protein